MSAIWCVMEHWKVILTKAEGHGQYCFSVLHNTSYCTKWSAVIVLLHLTFPVLFAYLDQFLGIVCCCFYTPTPRRGRGVYCSTSVRPSVLPSVQDIFRRIFLSNCWWQKSDIWSQASYRYTILWVAFLDPWDSYFLFADLVGFYTHWTYMHIFRHIFLSNHWWQKSDIWSQASYRYPISWERFWIHQIPTSCLPT